MSQTVVVLRHDLIVVSPISPDALERITHYLRDQGIKLTVLGFAERELMVHDLREQPPQVSAAIKLVMEWLLDQEWMDAIR